MRGSTSASAFVCMAEMGSPRVDIKRGTRKERLLQLSAQSV